LEFAVAAILIVCNAPSLAALFLRGH
jgi:hypothetical protein